MGRERVRTGLGQDSHRFLSADSCKPCVVGGLIFEDMPGLDADSDGDVVFHAICNAISSLTGVSIMGKVAVELCHKDGITDSQVYVKKALETLGNQKIEHISFSLEGKRPRFEARTLEMRQKVASVMNLSVDQVGATSTSGDGLTDFGCGEGISCFCIVTTVESLLYTE